jgi:hypothetical protein
MRAIRTRRRLATVVGITAAVGLTAAGAAYALTAASFKYSSPKTGYVRISAMAFAPNGQGGMYFNGWDSGLSGTGAGCFNAGVDLPAGARVKAITFYFKSGPASQFAGDFWRRQLSTGGSLLLVTANPSNDTNAPSSVTKNIGSTKQAVTADRAYGVGVCTGDDGTFYGARIKYTYTSAGS